MNIVSMNEGTKIDYELSGAKLSLCDDTITLNLAKYQKSYEVTKDIMVDSEGDITTGEGLYYIAQIVIPAFTYTEATTTDEDGEEVTTRTIDALNTDDVTLKLFSIDGIHIN